MILVKRLVQIYQSINVDILKMNKLTKSGTNCWMDREEHANDQDWSAQGTKLENMDELAHECKISWLILETQKYSVQLCFCSLAAR